MSRSTSAIQVVAKAVRATIRNPRQALEALRLFPAVMQDVQSRQAEEAFKLLPSVVQGVQFSKEIAFRSPAQTQEGHAEAGNPLLTYFNAHREGHGIWKWMHYFDIYQRHFSKFIGREVQVMEVGIYSGGSLPMWREYFGPGCHIYGVDIEEACLTYKDDQTEVFIGDQADRSFWTKVREAVPHLDILIDDGGHQPEQQRITLEEMLPHLRPGGVYLCEDIQGAPNAFAAYLQGLAAQLHAWAPAETPGKIPGCACAPSPFQKAIRSIQLYPFVAVIERREQDLDQMYAPKHGTQWQPFL